MIENIVKYYRIYKGRQDIENIIPWLRLWPIGLFHKECKTRLFFFASAEIPPNPYICTTLMMRPRLMARILVHNRPLAT